MNLSKKINTVLLIGCMTAAVSACSLDKLEEFNNSYENPDITASVSLTTDENDAPAPTREAQNQDRDSATGSSSTTDETAAVETHTENTSPTPAQPDSSGSSDKTEAAPTPTETATAVTDIPSTVTQSPTPVADASATEAVSPTAAPTEAPTPTASENNSPAASDTPAVPKQDTRNEYWESTFLIWVPSFEAGTFTGQDANGTFDYAIFDNVSAADAKNYVNKCKSAGFDNIIADSSSGSSLAFKATNSSDWCVEVKYTDNRLTIASGFEDAADNQSDILRGLYSETMLQYLPEFSAGSYESNENSNDESEFTYIYYSGVTENDVRSYISDLKNEGYVYSPDEGDRDGIIWYMALNEEVFGCYVAYDNGIVKIGCGYGE